MTLTFWHLLFFKMYTKAIPNVKTAFSFVEEIIWITGQTKPK